MLDTCCNGCNINLFNRSKNHRFCSDNHKQTCVLNKRIYLERERENPRMRSPTFSGVDRTQQVTRAPMKWCLGSRDPTNKDQTFKIFLQFHSCCECKQSPAAGMLTRIQKIHPSPSNQTAGRELRSVRLSLWWNVFEKGHSCSFAKCLPPPPLRLQIAC